MATTILAFRMTGDTASFIRSWKNARTTLTGFSKQADAASKKLGQLGRAGFVRFTLPVVAGLGVGIKAFSDFDQALNESLAIIDDVTTAQRKQLSDLAKQMSGESTFAAKELAEGYFFLASAGLDVEQSIAALPVVTTFAQAGMFDLATATDLLTDAHSALGPQIEETGDLLTDLTKLSDILVKANTLANASVSQFAEALTTEAGTAMRQFRIDVEDGVAVLAAFADQGIKGNIAGSLFARATRLLAKAASENAEAFKNAGIAVFDANEEFRSFADIAQDMEERFEGMSIKARTAELKLLGFAARTQQAILPLIGMSDKLRQLRGDLEKAGGVTQSVADKQLQSFANQMKLVRNEINLGAIALGESLAPRVLEIARHFSDLSKQFQALSKEQRNSIINWALLAAGIPVALLALAGILKTISILTNLVKGLNIALAFLAANPVVALAVVVAAATVKIFQLVDSIKEWREAVKQEKASLDRLNDTLAVVEAKYGSLEKLRRLNRDRWKEDAKAREQFNKVLKEETNLQSELEKLEANLSVVGPESQAAVRLQEQISGLKKEIEGLDTAGFERKIKELEAIASRSDLSSTVVKGFREQINSLKAELAVLATEEEIGFAPGEADFAAAEKFRKALSDAAFEQLDTEQKINELLKRRIALGAQIENAQKDSKEFFDLRREALKIEVEAVDLAQKRKDELKEEAEAQFKVSRFAGAVEAGSVADFQARLRGRAERQDLEKLAKKRNAELEELNERVEENTGILREAVDAIIRDTTTTVTIA